MTSLMLGNCTRTACSLHHLWVERAEFTADEAHHWSGDEYDWDVVRGYLENLVQQGLLTAA